MEGQSTCMIKQPSHSFDPPPQRGTPDARTSGPGTVKGAGLRPGGAPHLPNTLNLIPG